MDASKLRNTQQFAAAGDLPSNHHQHFTRPVFDQQQDLLMDTAPDEDESPTLAAPMTLVGAKHLSHPPILPSAHTPPLALHVLSHTPPHHHNNSLHHHHHHQALTVREGSGSTPPSHHQFSSPPTTATTSAGAPAITANRHYHHSSHHTQGVTAPHHSQSSPSLHHHHHIHHLLPLSSPSPPLLPSPLHHLASSSPCSQTPTPPTLPPSHPLAQSSPAAMHSAEGLWQPPEEGDDVEEEDNLPSTVDIQAIRDSPSSSPCANRLMTIDENWDTTPSSPLSGGGGEDEDYSHPNSDARNRRGQHPRPHNNHQHPHRRGHDLGGGAGEGGLSRGGSQEEDEDDDNSEDDSNRGSHDEDGSEEEEDDDSEDSDDRESLDSEDDRRHHQEERRVQRREEEMVDDEVGEAAEKRREEEQAKFERSEALELEKIDKEAAYNSEGAECRGRRPEEEHNNDYMTLGGEGGKKTMRNQPISDVVEDLRHQKAQCGSSCSLQHMEVKCLERSSVACEGNSRGSKETVSRNIVDNDNIGNSPVSTKSLSVLSRNVKNSNASSLSYISSCSSSKLELGGVCWRDGEEGAREGDLGRSPNSGSAGATQYKAGPTRTLQAVQAASKEKQPSPSHSPAAETKGITTTTTVVGATGGTTNTTASKDSTVKPTTTTTTTTSSFCSTKPSSKAGMSKTAALGSSNARPPLQPAEGSDEGSESASEGSESESSSSSSSSTEGSSSSSSCAEEEEDNDQKNNSSEESSSSDEGEDCEEEEEDASSSPRNKPLPRHKPQLVAPELRVSLSTKSSSEAKEEKDPLKSRKKPLVRNGKAPQRNEEETEEEEEDTMKASSSTSLSSSSSTSCSSSSSDEDSEVPPPSHDKTKKRSTKQPSIGLVLTSKSKKTAGIDASSRDAKGDVSLKASKHASVEVLSSNKVSKKFCSTAKETNELTKSSQRSKPSKELTKSRNSSCDSLFPVPSKAVSKGSKCHGGKSHGSKRAAGGKRDLDQEFDKLLCSTQSISLTHSGDATVASSSKKPSSSKQDSRTVDSLNDVLEQDLDGDEEFPLIIGRGRRKFKPLLPYKVKVDAATAAGGGVISPASVSLSGTVKSPAAMPPSVGGSHAKGEEVLGRTAGAALKSLDKAHPTKRVKIEDRRSGDAAAAIGNLKHITRDSKTALGKVNKEVKQDVVRTGGVNRTSSSNFIGIGGVDNCLKSRTALSASAGRTSEGCRSKVFGTMSSDVTLLVGGVRPTIADLVKVRERRKSFERDTSSGSEWERRKSGEWEHGGGVGKGRSKRCGLGAASRRKGDSNRKSRKSGVTSSLATTSSSSSSSSAAPASQKPRRPMRQLSQSSLDSSSSYLSESVTSDADRANKEEEEGDLSMDSTDSITQDDDAEPGGDVMMVTGALDTAALISSFVGASVGTPLPLAPPSYITLKSMDSLAHQRRVALTSDFPPAGLPCSKSQSLEVNRKVLAGHDAALGRGRSKQQGSINKTLNVKNLQSLCPKDTQHNNHSELISEEAQSNEPSSPDVRRRSDSPVKRPKTPVTDHRKSSPKAPTTCVDSQVIWISPSKASHHHLSNSSKMVKPVQSAMGSSRACSTACSNSSSSRNSAAEPRGGGSSSCCYRDGSSSDSDSSLSDHNIQVDLDTEQTQTFSVSENNFNQGRLTLKIAALKMSKFGSSGLREVGSCAPLPTRSDMHHPPPPQPPPPPNILLPPSVAAPSPAAPPPSASAGSNTAGSSSSYTSSSSTSTNSSSSSSSSSSASSSSSSGEESNSSASAAPRHKSPSKQQQHNKKQQHGGLSAANNHHHHQSDKIIVGANDRKCANHNSSSTCNPSNNNSNNNYNNVNSKRTSDGSKRTTGSDICGAHQHNNDRVNHVRTSGTSSSSKGSSEGGAGTPSKGKSKSCHGHSGHKSSEGRRGEVLLCKVKTAAERKTYVDALPPFVPTTSGGNPRRRKGGSVTIKSESGPPVLYTSGGGVPHPAGGEEDDDEQLSQLAHHFSQINEGPQDGLQELDQEDLAALLPDINATSNGSQGDVATSPAPPTTSTSDGAREGVPATRPLSSECQQQECREAGYGEGMELAEDEEEDDDDDDDEDDEEEEGPEHMDVDAKVDHRRRKEMTKSCSKGGSSDTLTVPTGVGGLGTATTPGGQHEEGGVEALTSLPHHLDTYIPLDCNLSNVSPDSGIQSVNGSPLHQVMSSPHHHSPLYSSSTTTTPSSHHHLTSAANTPRSATSEASSCFTAISSAPGSVNSHHHHHLGSRPYSPCQDSPPPPVLQPAITPPHLTSSSPRQRHSYGDEDEDEHGNPVSPVMPTLKCQVDPPPPWLLLRKAEPPGLVPFGTEAHEAVLSPGPEPLPGTDERDTPKAGEDEEELEPADTMTSESQDRSHVEETIATSDECQASRSLEQQGMNNSNRGPGRPPDTAEGDLEETKKRPRGRPKGSKNKRTLLAESISIIGEKNLSSSDRLVSLNKSSEKEVVASDYVAETILCNNIIEDETEKTAITDDHLACSESVQNDEENTCTYDINASRDCSLDGADTGYGPLEKPITKTKIIDNDAADCPSVDTESGERMNTAEALDSREDSGTRSKAKTACAPVDAQSRITASKTGPATAEEKRQTSAAASEPGRVKRSVGRPRKVPKQDNSETCSVSLPPEVSTKKSFSDQIVHKIINEKVRNSEKSDKLSVHGQCRDGGGGVAGGGHDPPDVSSPPKLYSQRSRNNSPCTDASSKGGTKAKSSRKARVEGIPLEEKKKRRGRKKQLPAIFRKVYGSLVDEPKTWSKSVDRGVSAHKPSPTIVPVLARPASESMPMAASSKAIHKKKKKKHMKQFKSKHKNIVDPAFLVSLEELLVGLEGCYISKSPGVSGQTSSGEGGKGGPGGDITLPAIFRVKRGSLLTALGSGSKKRRAAADKRTSDRESGTEGENSKEKLSGKRKKKLQELPKQGRDRSEANEQRLPLKKRHRHISTAVPTEHTQSLTTAVPTEHTLSLTTAVPSEQTLSLTTSIPSDHNLCVTTIGPTQHSLALRTAIATEHAFSLTTAVSSEQTLSLNTNSTPSTTASTVNSSCLTTVLPHLGSPPLLPSPEHQVLASTKRDEALLPDTGNSCRDMRKSESGHHTGVAMTAMSGGFEVVTSCNNTIVSSNNNNCTKNLQLVHSLNVQEGKNLCKVIRRDGKDCFVLENSPETELSDEQSARAEMVAFSSGKCNPLQQETINTNGSIVRSDHPSNTQEEHGYETTLQKKLYASGNGSSSKDGVRYNNSLTRSLDRDLNGVRCRVVTAVNIDNIANNLTQSGFTDGSVNLIKVNAKMIASNEPSSSTPSSRNAEQIQQSLSSTTPKKRHRLEAEMKTIASYAAESAQSKAAFIEPLCLPTTGVSENVPCLSITESVGLTKVESVNFDKGCDAVSAATALTKPKYDRSCKTKDTTNSGKDAEQETPLQRERPKLARSVKVIETPRPPSSAAQEEECRSTTPSKSSRAGELVCEQRVSTRQSKSPSVSPTSSPVKRRPESRTSTISTRSRAETLSKPGTPDLIADTNVSSDKIAQDIIITDGILESAKGKMDLLSCKVDLYHMDGLLLNTPSVGSSPTKLSHTLDGEGECGSTHSDSDIASEHEPLRESDQSGFMSDKEEASEAVKERRTTPQKRLKKKRELRSPRHKAALGAVRAAEAAAEDDEDNQQSPLPAPAKKKVKKRKPNRTGFPTVKRKKKVFMQAPSAQEDDDKNEEEDTVEQSSSVERDDNDESEGYDDLLLSDIHDNAHDQLLKAEKSVLTLQESVDAEPRNEENRCSSPSSDKPVKIVRLRGRPKKRKTPKLESTSLLSNVADGTTVVPPDSPTKSRELRSARKDACDGGDSPAPKTSAGCGRSVSGAHAKASSHAELADDSLAELDDVDHQPSTLDDSVVSCDTLPDINLVSSNDPEADTPSADCESERAAVAAAALLPSVSVLLADVNGCGGGRLALSDVTSGGISSRTRRKRELVLEELSNPALKRRRKKLLPRHEPEKVEDSDSGLPLLFSPAPTSEAGVSALAPTAPRAAVGGVGAVSSEPASSDESSRSLLVKRRMPRWKKKFLVAGLLSDYYKQDEPPVRRNGDVMAIVRKHKSVMLSSRPMERLPSQSPLLPPPCYCRKWLRERLIDFQLPYDLWWLHTNNMLPGRDLVPSWNYKKIKSNIFYDVKPSHCAAESQACNCRRPGNPEALGCGEDCINRMMFIECCPNTCPIPERCSNQRIQRHQNLTCLMRFMTSNKGWGVKVTQPIRTGTFILEYVGEVVSEKEFKHRMQTTYANDTHHYCLNLDRGMVIDGHRVGGDCRFVNHSCEPNCEMQKWGVNGQYRMALYALRDIEAGTELTYDYNFSLFNPAEGQECKCGSENCRGVIGGRSQRVNGLLTDSKRKAAALNKKDMALRKRKRVAGGCGSVDSDTSTASSQAIMKPLTQQHKMFIQQHSVFLIRNLTKLRKSRERIAKLPEKKLLEEGENVSNSDTGSTTITGTASADVASGSAADTIQHPEIAEEDETNSRVEKFLTHFTALNTARSVKTRRLAQAEDDPEMTRLAKLAQIFKDIYDKLVASRDPVEDKPLATPFMSLPSKKKHPNYYTRIGEPIDLGTIEKNILTGQYKTAESFDGDVMRLLYNSLRYFGRNTPVGRLACGLRRVYSECKLQFKPLLEEVLGPDGLPPPFAVTPATEGCESEEEDIIRCVCNMPRDEGLMIQCERCLVWQHCDCMGVGGGAKSPAAKVKTENTAASEGYFAAGPSTGSCSSDQYLCEECSPRRVSPEVPMTPQPPDAPHTDKYFITLLRDNLQLKQGDSVYILRDRPPHKPGDRHQPAYKMAKDLKPHDLLIFKIENLWIDEKGDKFAFGHHYLRPHETFHEPWRKFFSNEVIRSPLCDILPLDMVVGHCWVLDLNSYCRGRPIEAQEEHVYVCEYRVDKIARIFSKISKPKYPVCTKSYAFLPFPVRAKPQRTYTPHEVIATGRSTGPKTTIKKEAKDPVKSKKNSTNDGSMPEAPVISSTESASTGFEEGPPPPAVTAPELKRASSASTSRSASRSLERGTGTVEQRAVIAPAQTVGLKSRAGKQNRVNCVASRLLSRLGGPARGGRDGGNLESLLSTSASQSRGKSPRHHQSSRYSRTTGEESTGGARPSSHKQAGTGHYKSRLTARSAAQGIRTSAAFRAVKRTAGRRGRPGGAGVGDRRRAGRGGGWERRRVDETVKEVRSSVLLGRKRKLSEGDLSELNKPPVKRSDIRTREACNLESKRDTRRTLASDSLVKSVDDQQTAIERPVAENKLSDLKERKSVRRHCKSLRASDKKSTPAGLRDPAPSCDTNQELGKKHSTDHSIIDDDRGSFHQLQDHLAVTGEGDSASPTTKDGRKVAVEDGAAHGVDNTFSTNDKVTTDFPFPSSGSAPTQPPAPTIDPADASSTSASTATAEAPSKESSEQHPKPQTDGGRGKHASTACPEEQAPVSDVTTAIKQQTPNTVSETSLATTDLTKSVSFSINLNSISPHPPKADEGWLSSASTTIAEDVAEATVNSAIASAEASADCSLHSNSIDSSQSTQNTDNVQIASDSKADTASTLTNGSVCSSLPSTVASSLANTTHSAASIMNAATLSTPSSTPPPQSSPNKRQRKKNWSLSS